MRGPGGRAAGYGEAVAADGTAQLPRSPANPGAGARVLPGRRPYFWWRLLRRTAATCFRYRVTGLAAEAGFFALLSLPPLVLGLFGTLGYVRGAVDPGVVQRARDEIVRIASIVLTDESVQGVIVPTFDDVLRQGRFEIVSLGFLLSLWSGSRAVNVYVDTVSIMYGLGGVRGIIRQRALSFGLYLLALLLGVVFLPLVLAGPSLVAAALPDRADGLIHLYWPLVVLLSVPSLALLYSISVPARVRWWRSLPGAVCALVLWVLFSFLLRWVIDVSVGGPSIYGPLAAPIVVLLWLYLLAISVLIGAALNASADRLAPTWSTAAARQELARSRQDEEERDSAADAAATLEDELADSAGTLTPVRERR